MVHYATKSNIVTPQYVRNPIEMCPVCVLKLPDFINACSGFSTSISGCPHMDESIPKARYERSAGFTIASLVCTVSTLLVTILNILVLFWHYDSITKFQVLEFVYAETVALMSLTIHFSVIRGREIDLLVKNGLIAVIEATNCKFSAESVVPIARNALTYKSICGSFILFISIQIAVDIYLKKDILIMYLHMQSFLCAASHYFYTFTFVMHACMYTVILKQHYSELKVRMTEALGRLGPWVEDQTLRRRFNIVGHMKKLQKHHLIVVESVEGMNIFLDPLLLLCIVLLVFMIITSCYLSSVAFFSKDNREVPFATTVLLKTLIMGFIYTIYSINSENLYSSVSVHTITLLCPITI